MMGYPHPMGMMPPPPPGAMMPPGVPPMGMMPPGGPMGMMPPPPPGGMMMPPPHPMMGQIPPPGMMGGGPRPGPSPQQPMGLRPPPQPKGKELFDNQDFPALGEEAMPKKEDAASDEMGDADEETKDQDEPAQTQQRQDGDDGAPPTTSSEPPRFYFNVVNPSSHNRYVPASRIADRYMPARDVTYIVHAMLRPLQSLDAYNDDYYHWSLMNRAGGNGAAMMGAPAALAPQSTPTPVWKEVKVTARARDEKYVASMASRAQKFAEEKKSLGQMVKTNVKRPKALLTTPVLSKDDNAGTGGGNDDEAKEEDADSRYEAEQRRNRISMWKARVSVDRGHAALLSLTELRRLIQAHAGEPRVANDLMADVKANVDLMHASLGVGVAVDSNGKRGSKKVSVDRRVLSSTLSLPKGRTMCARVIEDGILPHPSACRVLPEALGCVFSCPLPSVEGEDRLLHALTGLVLTPRPGVDPAILLQCLDVAINAAGGDKEELTTITGSQLRMKLLYSILSVGKNACTASSAALAGEWTGKEKEFMGILAAGQQKQQQK